MQYLKIDKIFNDHCREISDMDGLMSFFNAHNHIVWSWGAHDFKNFENKCLRFTVQGRHHTGRVYIFFNTLNVFEIYLTDLKNKIIGEVIEGVNIEELINVLDKKIEWIEEYGSN